MAGGKERALRRRIKSVQSTKKITRAMELIAATRVMKAQERAHAARPYSEQITTVIQNLAAAGGVADHPLLRQVDQARRVGYVVVTGDRGLAGPYNSTVIRAAERELQARRADGVDYSLFVVGKKGEGYFRFRGFAVEEAYTGFADRPHYEDARRVADDVRLRFEEGELDEVVLVYTRFLSVASQQPVVRQFLPLTGVGEEDVDGPTADYEYEPSPSAILTSLLPRYVEARLFAALLDGAASFFAAQQRAMKAATDNADELITKLSRVMNRARQDAITTEIMEIVGGAEALRSGQSSEEDTLPDHLVNRDFLPDQITK